MLYSDLIETNKRVAKWKIISSLQASPHALVEDANKKLWRRIKKRILIMETVQINTKKRAGEKPMSYRPQNQRHAPPTPPRQRKPEAINPNTQSEKRK